MAGDLALQHPPRDRYLTARCRTAIWARVGRDIPRIVDARPQVACRGAASSRFAGSSRPCSTSYVGLLGGLAFAIVLVYLLIVVNFQSWLDPFIIITALPAALAGIVLFLFATHTTLSVPALMGAIMCMGVATANSILVVSFAKERLAHHGDAARGGHRGRLHALPPGADDGARHDHRHGPDGAGPGRGRRAERAARPRGDRRTDVRHRRHAGLRPRGLQPAASKPGHSGQPEEQEAN